MPCSDPSRRRLPVVLLHEHELHLAPTAVVPGCRGMCRSQVRTGDPWHEVGHAFDHHQPRKSSTNSEQVPPLEISK